MNLSKQMYLSSCLKSSFGKKIIKLSYKFGNIKDTNFKTYIFKF